MNKKIVVVVMMVVMIATAFPAAGLLPMKAGFTDQVKQIEQSILSKRGVNDVWPMFRHDAGNTGCSSFEAPFTNHTIWKKKITDEFHYGTTPILYADKIYVSTNWFYKSTPKMTNPFTDTPPSPSEIIQSLRCHDNDTSIGLYCLDAKTGEQRWFRPMAAPNDPAIVDGKLYITDVNYYSYLSSLYCLNATTGDVIWEKSVNALILSPTIVADQKIFLGCLDLYSYAGSVKCYDLSGSLLWNKPLSTYELIWFTAPAYSGGYLYFIATNLYSYFTGTLYCLNAATGQKMWSHSIFSLFIFYFGAQSAVSTDARVYVTDFDMNSYEGTLKCYDGATGNTVWTCHLGSVLSFVSPAVCGDSVYITGSDLYSYMNWLYRINVSNGMELWKVANPTPSAFGFGAVICSADKVVIVPDIYYGDANELYCCDRLDGTVDWHYTADSYILGEPSIGDSRVYAAYQNGELYAFEDALKIQNISGGLLGVHAQLQNIDNTTSLTNITWNISVAGGYFGYIHRTRTGTITELKAGSSKTIRLLPILGMGKIEIVVKVSMPTIHPITKVKQGMALGPVCIVLP
jgi:outer membrane protein assembly factor BamB